MIKQNLIAQNNNFFIFGVEKSTIGHNTFSLEVESYKGKNKNKKGRRKKK
jgi:hypothetical protein